MLGETNRTEQHTRKDIACEVTLPTKHHCLGLADLAKLA